jgi:hypothetical protein
MVSEQDESSSTLRLLFWLRRMAVCATTVEVGGVVRAHAIGYICELWGFL